MAAHDIDLEEDVEEVEGPQSKGRGKEHSTRVVTEAKGEVSTLRGTTPTPTTERITTKIKFAAAKIPSTAHLVPTKSLCIATPLKEATPIGILFQPRRPLTSVQAGHHVVSFPQKVALVVEGLVQENTPTIEGVVWENICTAEGAMEEVAMVGDVPVGDMDARLDSFLNKFDMVGVNIPPPPPSMPLGLPFEWPT